jgi:hypothetical protein
MLQLPLVILFEEHGAGQANDGCLVWNAKQPRHRSEGMRSASDVSAAFDFLVEAFNRVA